VRHDRLGPAAEEGEQFVDQPALGGASGNDRLEQMGVADLLDAPDGVLTDRMVMIVCTVV
jgi:hypothetical protein